MEPSYEALWNTLQKRLSDMSERKQLIPQINQSRKEAIIRLLQWSRMKHKPLQGESGIIEETFKKTREQWKLQVSRYQQLAQNELEHLEKAQSSVEQEIKEKSTYDLDLMEHHGAIKASLESLKDEMKAVLKPLEEGTNRAF